MSRSTTDGVWNSYYYPHLHGGSSAVYNNPSSNSVASLTTLYLNRLREMSLARFKWIGLPDSIDPRFVETVLLDQGLIVYCRPEEFNPTDSNGIRLIDNPELTDFMLRATPTGVPDYQDNPLAYMVYANNMYSAQLDADQCVPVWCNASRIPETRIIQLYARRLAEADTTTDINMKGARHSRVVTVPEGQQLTATNLLRQVDSGEPTVFGSERLDREAYQVFDTGLDFHIIGAVQDARNRIFNEAMTALGINSADTGKRERMVVSEVESNDEQVSMNRMSALGERQRGAERINKMFPGLKIRVEWNVEEYPDEKEDDSNGDVHDNDQGNDS